MKKQLFAAAFCCVLLFMVGLLWWRVRELEKTVNSLRIQPAANSTVVWQNRPQSKNNSPKKQVFKLIDSPEPVDPGSSNIGVPWTVERAMIGGDDQNAALKRDEEWHLTVPATPDTKLVPDQPDSK
jgi:hypothetical protein